MRLAAIYDVHGNLPALEAVLQEIREEGADQVVVGGDVVPGPMPEDCLSVLEDFSVPVHFLRGNGESDVLAARRGEELIRVPPAFREVIHWTARQLPAGQLDRLAAWPLTWSLKVPGLGRVLCCHATPRHDNEIFTRTTPEARLLPVFADAGAALVLCGHTHMQFDRRIGDVRVVNAGSVGMPFGEPGAYWALLHGGGIQLRRTSYDLEAAAASIRATRYPADFDVQRPPTEEEMLRVFEAAALR